MSTASKSDKSCKGASRGSQGVSDANHVIVPSMVQDYPGTFVAHHPSSLSPLSQLKPKIPINTLPKNNNRFHKENNLEKHTHKGIQLKLYLLLRTNSSLSCCTNKHPNFESMTLQSSAAGFILQHKIYFGC